MWTLHRRRRNASNPYRAYQGQRRLLNQRRFHRWCKSPRIECTGTLGQQFLFVWCHALCSLFLNWKPDTKPSSLVSQTGSHHQCRPLRNLAFHNENYPVWKWQIRACPFWFCLPWWAAASPPGYAPAEPLQARRMGLAVPACPGLPLVKSTSWGTQGRLPALLWFHRILRHSSSLLVGLPSVSPKYGVAHQGEELVLDTLWWSLWQVPSAS